MIRIEAASTPAPLTKLVEVKALMRIWIAHKAIRINKNIVQVLVDHGLIMADSPGFYSLTRRGVKTTHATEIIEVDVPFDLFVKFDSEKEIVNDFLQPKYNLWKIMVTTCVSCAKESQNPLEKIEDKDGNNGAYCKDCLSKGYDLAVKAAKARKRNGVLTR